MRAMSFEALVTDERPVFQLLITAIGRLGRDRPTAVRWAKGRVSPATTAKELEMAHHAAIDDNQATRITELAVLYLGLEERAQTCTDEVLA